MAGFFNICCVKGDQMSFGSPQSFIPSYMSMSKGRWFYNSQILKIKMDNGQRVSFNYLFC